MMRPRDLYGFVYLFGGLVALVAFISFSGCAHDFSVGYTLQAKQLIEEKRQYDQAIKSAEKSIEYSPRYAPGWYWLGIAHYRKNEYNEAIKAFKKVLELKPSKAQHESSYGHLGWSYYFLNKYDDSVRNFSRALGLNPKIESSLRGRGWSYYMKGDYGKAAGDFNKALENIQPNNTFAFEDAYRGRGLTYYFQGDFEKAISYFNKAIENIGPKEPSFLAQNIRGKAFSYLGMGDSETAINLIKQAKGTSDYDTNYHLSLIYYIAGDTEKAWEYRGGRGMVGIRGRDYKKGTVTGVEVVGTEAGGPSEEAGIVARDVIIKLDDIDITGIQDFVAKAGRLVPGTTARLNIVREGVEKELLLKVASAEPLMEAAPLLAPIIARRKEKPAEIVARPVIKKARPPAEKLPPPRPDTYAVIIGIDYKDRADIPSLKFPSQDSKKVYDLFTDPRYGGVPRENTMLLLNEEATRNKMIAALRKSKTWDGYIYVYFSGHGAPKAKGNNLTDAFLVPDDVIITDPEALEDTSIKLSYLQDLVDSSKAKGVMVALDACFTGGGKSIVPKGAKPLVGVLVSPELIKSQGTGRIIITSSAVNQQSWEDDTELRGGIFSHYLLEGLRGKAGKDIWVKVNELAGYIKENVSRAARKLKGVEQEPQISGKADFAVTRNWARAKVADIEIARTKIKAAFEKGHITVGQLNRALDELKTPSRSKTLEAFLEGKIDAKRFGGLY